MKFLKKASLAAAIAAASISAQAGMVALDDETMAATTGQAGVTIEINIDNQGISVGEIEYIDEGSVSLQNLTVKNVTNLTQTIDVDTNGNLLLTATGVDGMEIALGDTGNGQFSAVALRSASGETTELINNLDMTLNLGASSTKIINMEAAGNGTLVAGLPVGALGSSVVIKSNSSIEITDMNVGAFGYTSDQAANRAAVARVAGVIADTDEAEAAYAGQLASGSAVQVEGLKFYGTGGVGTKATIDQTIWAKG